MVRETKEPYREQMFDLEVRVEGDLATVWGRYDFHVGERLTNCGTNALQLVRTIEGWKIVQISSTILIENCGRKTMGGSDTGANDRATTSPAT